MKNSALTKILIALICVLIAVIGIAAGGAYSLASAIKKAAADFQTEEKAQEGSIALGNSDLGAFYTTLYEKLEQSGSLEASEEQLSLLANEITQRSFSNLQVESMDFGKDEIRITLVGEGVPVSDYNASFMASAAGKAAWSYLGSNFFEAASSLFSSQEAIEQQLYGKFAPQLLESMRDEVKNKSDREVSYTLVLRQEDGEWKLVSSQT